MGTYGDHLDKVEALGVGCVCGGGCAMVCYWPLVVDVFLRARAR